MAKYFKQRKGYAQGIGDIFTEEELQNFLYQICFVTLLP